MRLASIPVLALLLGLFPPLAGLPLRAEDSWATAVDRISIADDFQVELVYTVPFDEQGSWINMTPDPQGRLIVSDQNGRPMGCCVHSTACTSWSMGTLPREVVCTEFAIRMGMTSTMKSVCCARYRERASMGLMQSC